MRIFEIQIDRLSGKRSLVGGEDQLLIALQSREIELVPGDSDDRTIRHKLGREPLRRGLFDEVELDCLAIGTRQGDGGCGQGESRPAKQGTGEERKQGRQSGAEFLHGTNVGRGFSTAIVLPEIPGLGKSKGTLDTGRPKER